MSNDKEWAEQKAKDFVVTTCGGWKGYQNLAHDISKIILEGIERGRQQGLEEAAKIADTHYHEHLNITRDDRAAKAARAILIEIRKRKAEPGGEVKS